MLRVIASSAIHYAVDGVVSAEAVGHATRSELLEQVARTRARDLLDEAEESAHDTFRRAAEQGYAHGYADAMAAFVPLAMELLQQEHILAEAALTHVREVLCSDLGQLGFEAPFIAQWCSLQAQDLAAHATLHVPLAREDLAGALSSHPLMNNVDTRLSDVDHPLLELGKLTFEFDPTRQLLRKSEHLLFDEAWKDRLEKSAQAYAERAQSVLNDARVRTRLKSLGSMT
jgi:hypothetical protein